MTATLQKQTGAYYTPDYVVRSLVRWAVRSKNDRMLDPACGDGRFLVPHPRAVGVEQDPVAAAVVHERVPGALIHEGDFFSWAGSTKERFECAAGNPPFIRYQRFTGAVRAEAQRLCARHGARFSSLSSSWAPFIVATAALLKRGGRLAFIVPAEIGHATYAKPVLQYMSSQFERVLLVLVRRKLFPGLSEDCWILYAEGFGSTTESIEIALLDQFGPMREPPPAKLCICVGLDEWERWNYRLRPFIVSRPVREFYEAAINDQRAVRLGDVARVGIGYVTGANDFFHLRPSEAKRLGIPAENLHWAVRNGRSLRGGSLTMTTVAEWIRRDEPVFLLRIQEQDNLSTALRRYLNSEAAVQAQSTFKCRSRDPWYVVPDVTVPDAFLSYMSGGSPSLVLNEAGCVGTNSVHVVHLKRGISGTQLARSWNDSFTALSCEIEGHPLGGGMLKVEPREAARVAILRGRIDREGRGLVSEGIEDLRRWRHYGETARQM